MNPQNILLLILLIVALITAIYILAGLWKEHKLAQEKIRMLEAEKERIRQIRKQLRENMRVSWRPPHTEHKHRKIRGFKPKTAHEKRLWKPEVKPEEA